MVKELKGHAFKFLRTCTKLSVSTILNIGIS